MPTITDLHTDWNRHGHRYLSQFATRQTSFVPTLLPQTALTFTVQQTLDLLARRIGNSTFGLCLNPNATVPSPVHNQPDSAWLKQSNMVGINVRTIGSFWNVMAYTLTVPASHDSIHLLPIWEPGVVGSLYGMVSWNINPEFYSPELARFLPHLNTVEKQLKVVVNILHALGRTVGMDVIPHTDRFSEMVLTHPALFEWVRQDNGRIIDHSENVHRHVEEAIWQFLVFHGAADDTGRVFTKEMLFDHANPMLTEAQRHRILFGWPGEFSGRLGRRIALIRFLVRQGLETLPMTMAPPYRGLHINAEKFVLDDYGQRWYDYEFDQPQAMSRVFGPLARYKFFHSQDNNQNWQLDFENPNRPAWDYFNQQVLACQHAYNFDFMRGDMAHVQPRPDGVPASPSTFYDPLQAVKKHIQTNGWPHFGFYAETFLAPPNTMGYGDELAHLEAIEADVTLGDLQSCAITTDTFRQRFTDYDNWLRTRQFAPCFTVMTADKDDPRFDEFYRTGNLFRYFVALFLTDMPSYVGLGFEIRNLHEERGQNEEYTKLYVFQIRDDAQTDKVTHGPFVWGRNAEQFAAIGRIRALAEQLWPDIAGQASNWVVPPIPESDIIVWSVGQYKFSASLTGALPEPEMAETVLFDEVGCRVELQLVIA
jgi:hypothetical protein